MSKVQPFMPPQLMAQGLEAKEPLADKQIAGIIELDPYLVDTNPFWKGAQQLTIVEVRAVSHMPIRHAFPFAGNIEKERKKRLTTSV